jgi:creatinine amidohydrolase
MADILPDARARPGAGARLLGDGSLGGLYERADEDVLRVWQAGVEEVREQLANGWADA